MIKQMLINTIIRRLLGYAGVAAVVGLQDDITQLMGMAVALVTFALSIWDKIKKARG